jgi:tetraacyldisaccharide 4'-kinase
MVAWLARWLREQGVRVTLISRGYGATDGGRNDEALELEQQLPDVPHLQNADRAAAAAVAIEEFECQMILLDDGFQHRRLARDLDIVLLDACEPFGYGHVFPRGLLREPISGLKRAQVIALSRADMATADQREKIHQMVARYAPQAVWLEVAHQPQCLRSAEGHVTALESLTQQPVAGFCGIGNPRGFRHTLESIGYRVAAFREFPDHHAYTRKDIESLTAWANDSQAAAVICTQKDLVKIALEQLGQRPLHALGIGLGFLCGKEHLLDRLRPLLPTEAGT